MTPIRSVHQVTAGIAFAKDFLTFDGQLLHVLVGQVARTNTTSNKKLLGALPLGCTIIDAYYIGQDDSDASMTATLNVGYVGGSGVELVKNADMLIAGDGGKHAGVSDVLGGTLGAEEQVVGFYAETGDASSEGGPWTVVVLFATNNTA